MLTLINLLIIFFIALIIYQIILANDSSFVEGLDNYQPYDLNNPQNALILAQQNAGNIQVLKQQVDELTGLNKEVQDISGNVVTLQSQVTQLVAAQKQYADKLTGGGTPPNVTGIGSTSSTDTSNLVSS
jgi:TolA-binding protein